MQTNKYSQYYIQSNKKARKVSTLARAFNLSIQQNQEVLQNEIS